MHLLFSHSAGFNEKLNPQFIANYYRELYHENMECETNSLTATEIILQAGGTNIMKVKLVLSYDEAVNYFEN